MIALNLGGVVFADFEIPETINFGGEQMIAVHQLPGGSRVIDSLGPNDAEVRWSGRFRGSDAEERALLLDFMRRQGNQLLLTYSLHRYQVVIREFTANFQNGGLEIPYTIACTVALDETQALLSTAAGFIEAMAADLATALGLTDLIGSSTISTAVTAVSAAFTNYQAGVPTTTNALAATTAVAEGPLVAALQASISGAQEATQANIGTVNPSTRPVIAGANPSAMASQLGSAASGFGLLNNLYQLSGLLSRMSVNTANKGN